MTERKPAWQPWESWSERQIRERMEGGEFANLPGAGKPFADLGDPNDELWWIKQKLRREKISLLPPTLELRKEVADAKARIATASSEAQAREIVSAINRRIVAANAGATAGPPTDLMPLDPERVVAAWREGRR